MNEKELDIIYECDFENGNPVYIIYKVENGEKIKLARVYSKSQCKRVVTQFKNYFKERNNEEKHVK